MTEIWTQAALWMGLALIATLAAAAIRRESSSPSLRGIELGAREECQQDRPSAGKKLQPARVRGALGEHRTIQGAGLSSTAPRRKQGPLAACLAGPGAHALAA